MRLGIVILPPEEINKEVARLSKKLDQKYNLVFSVDNKKFFPHITLFHLETKRSSLPKILSGIRKLAATVRGFELTYKKPGGGEGYFDFGLGKSKEIYGLHKTVVKDFYKYNQKNGSHRILKLYRPHITIGRVVNEKDHPRVRKDIQTGFNKFAADNIALTELDDQAQVKKIIRIFRLAPSLDLAVRILKQGGIVVYPTDTAYGLAVDATNAAAVKNLYALKGRNFRKPVHVIYPSTVWLKKIVKLNIQALRLMVRFVPGPLTLVLPLKSELPSFKMLSAGTKTLGVRLPNHKLALELVKKFGKPITTTSANLSGGKNAYSVKEVKRQFEKKKISAKGGSASGGKPDYYLDGGRLKQTRPSTIVSLINGARIIRTGPISETQIKKALR